MRARPFAHRLLLLGALLVSPAAAQPAPYRYVLATPDLAVPGQPEQDEATENAIALEGMQVAYELLTPLLHENPQDRLRLAHALAERHRDAPFRYMMEQTMGLLLLSEYLAERHIEQVAPEELARRRPAGDSLAAVAFGLDLLLRNNNPNAHLLAAVLTVVDGYWTEESVAVQAAHAARAATAYLEKLERSDCPTCRAASGDERHLVLIRDGIARLEQLAARR